MKTSSKLLVAVSRGWLSSVTSLCVVGLLACGLPAFAQDANAGRALGVVTKIDADARQLTIRNDQGGEVAVSLDAKAGFRRVAPGETNLANAAQIAISDVHVGDRVLARGKAGEDAKSVVANLVVVMSQGDIASKQAAERADWDRRGITGIVAEATGDHIVVNVRTLEGVKPLEIVAAPNGLVRRYAPDSVKFADAKVSKLSDIRKGDQVRARGNRTPETPTESAKMAAEEIVSGAFRMIAGVVVSVDAQEGIVRINNLETKKQMNVKLLMDSSAKRLPPPLAQIVANRLHGVPDAAPGGRGPGGGGPGGEGAAAGPGGVGPGAGGPGAGGPPAGGPGAGGPGGGRGPGGGFGGGRGGRGGAADVQAMFDRAPAITVADLKQGDAIIVSSTVGASSDQVTAITLLAGVEPILTKPGSREMSLGDWNGGGGGDLGGLGGFGAP
jgi:hypothetical protein